MLYNNTIILPQNKQSGPFLSVSHRIDGDGVIKVADFGLTEDTYATNYYHRGRGEGEGEPRNEEKVPIRWMAPESIETDLYNELTDVVRTELSSVIVGCAHECLCYSSGHLE